ncbi:MAG: hypothetical protein QGD88_00745, partial [Anaerolineae bacterium]|nr:hypothetical protein [Anaerolineae bacterium]
MKVKNRFKLLSIIVLFAYIYSLISPTIAFADDPPPPTEISVVVTESPVADDPAPTEDPVVPTECSVAEDPSELQEISTECSGADDPPAPTEAPVVPTESPVADDPPAPTEAPVVPTECPVADDPSEIQEFSTECSVADDAPELQEYPIESLDTGGGEGKVKSDSTDEEGPAEPESEQISEIVTDAAELDITLADESGEPLILGTVEAAETLAEGDPYFVRGGTTYYFMPISVGCGSLTFCVTSENPIQAAIDDIAAIGAPDLLAAPDGVDRRTIYVEAGIYAEQVIIHNDANLNLVDLTLWGDPVDDMLMIPGAGPDAPILDGSSLMGTTKGITLNAYGTSVIGFVIQNYDTGIYHDVLSGNTPSFILNNDILNNEVGIQFVGGRGKPGPQVHYNTFVG